MTATAPARADVADDAATPLRHGCGRYLEHTLDRGVLCDNVFVASELRLAFERLMASSRTFRALLATVRRRPTLHLSIATVPECRSQYPSLDCDAQTSIRVFGTRAAVAEMRIRRGADVEAMIGHEFEHLRQWINGQLGTLVEPSGSLERVAVDVGRSVADEARGGIRISAR